MFKPKTTEVTFEKKLSDATETYGKFVVDEVLYAVDIAEGDFDSTYDLFHEFEQYIHCDVIKTLYYGN